MLPAPAIRGAFRTDYRARAAYAEGAGIYRILPAAVCTPSDTADLCEIVRWATDRKVPLVPRGAGSGMAGGNVGEGVVVDLTRIPSRLSVQPEGRIATTSANVTLADLNGAADRHGLRLPPDPSSGRWATLGGMLSTNAAGARSVRYGSVRRWVRALELVTADAEVVRLRRGASPTPGEALVLRRFEQEAAPALRAGAELVSRRFPRTRKNSCGYALDAWLATGDLLDLVVGAEGTLGFVTEIEWAREPAPAERAGLRLRLRSLDEIVRVVAALHGAQPSAVELLDRTFLDLVRGQVDVSLEGVEAVLLVEIERADSAALRQAADAAVQAVQDMTVGVDVAYGPRAAERLWAIRHAASPILASLPEGRRSLQVIEDACVPLEQMGDYIRAVRRAGAACGIPVVVFGHAGDGHVHVNVLPEVARGGWEDAVAGLLDEITDTVVRLGGTPSGEHGDGRLRAGLLGRVYGEDIVALFGRIKRAFDPLGIFAPGVLIPSGEPAISRLKAGARAIPLPEDIATALRNIERTGGYAKHRLDLV
jgi:FAD/FMN-containing dehydrogenase